MSLLGLIAIAVVALVSSLLTLMFAGENFAAIVATAAVLYFARQSKPDTQQQNRNTRRPRKFVAPIDTTRRRSDGTRSSAAARPSPISASKQKFLLTPVVTADPVSRSPIRSQTTRVPGYPQPLLRRSVSKTNKATSSRTAQSQKRQGILRSGSLPRERPVTGQSARSCRPEHCDANRAKASRQSSALRTYTHLAEALSQYDVKSESPRTIYKTIATCYQKCGHAIPSTPRQLENAAMYLKNCPSIDWKEALSTGFALARPARGGPAKSTSKPGLTKNGYDEETDLCYADGFPRCLPREVLEAQRKYSPADVETGGAVHKDDRLYNESTVYSRIKVREFGAMLRDRICNKDLSFDERDRLMPWALIPKTSLPLSKLFLNPVAAAANIPDSYHTTNKGVLRVFQRAKICPPQIIGKHSDNNIIARVQDHVYFYQTTPPQLGDIEEYARKVDEATLGLLAMFGGFDPQRSKTCYPEDLVPYNDGLADSKAIAYWLDLWSTAGEFWERLGYSGEYDQYGYVHNAATQRLMWMEAAAKKVVKRGKVWLQQEAFEEANISRAIEESLGTEAARQASLVGDDGIE